MKNKILSAILVIATLFVLAASASTVGAASANDFTYEVAGSGVRITGYTGKDRALTIPETLGGKTVVEIGDFAFYNKNLKSVVIPGSCKTIGTSAFANNMSLETVVLGAGVEKIGDGAFASCYALKTVNIPKSVTEIAYNSFAGDSNLKLQCYEGSYGLTYASSTGVVFDASPVEATSATITRKPSKLVFYEGEEIVTDGLVIEVQYNDGTSVPYDRGYTVSGYDPSKVGTQLVSVRFDDIVATYTVTVVANNAVELELVKLPKKTVYPLDTELDLTGIEVKATLESGDVVIVSEGFEAEYDFSELGTATVALTYKGSVITFDVKVIHNATSIKVTTAPKRVVYTVGDEFDPEGLVITATLKDGSVITADVADLTFEYDFSEAGQKTVKVMFGGQETFIDVIVKVPATIRYIGLDEEFMPKTLYKIGEKFSPVGMYIYVKFSDGSAALVSWKNVAYYINGKPAVGYVFEKEGVYRVSYGYAGQGDNDLIVYVSEDGTMPVTSISIHTLPTKTTYAPGEQLSTEGMQIFINYADGTTAIIDSGFSATANLTAAGTQVVTVGYKGATATFEVEVVTVTVSSIAVTKNPTKTSYKVGETFSASGLEVTATYSDGTTKVVTGYTLSVVDSTSAGTKTVTVTFEGKTATFTVTYEKETQSETQTTESETSTQPTESETQPTESETSAQPVESDKQTESSATESTAGTDDTKKSSLWWIFLIIAIVLVIVLVILYLFVFRKNRDDDEETEEDEEEETEEEVETEASEEAPVEEAPAEEASVEETPVEETPVEETPVEEAPAEEVPAEEAPAEEVPAEETPDEEKKED